MKSLLLLSIITAMTAMPTPETVLSKRDACPRDLPAPPGFEFPHLIVPVSKDHPEEVFPNTFFPVITPNDLGTVFNFDILHDDRICELGFYFPKQEQLTTSSFTYSGLGTFEVVINEPGDGAQSGFTTWNRQPAPGPYAGFPKIIHMSPGNYYSLFIGKCAAGVWSVTISSIDSTFGWFQDYGTCPIGPFVTYNRPEGQKE